jgi:hypothetical protein
LGERYDNALAVDRGKNRAFDDQHPYISEALQGVGELASTYAYGGGNPLLGGFARGAIEGFGEGEGGFENRVEQAIRNGIMEALPEFGMMRAEAGAEGSRKAGAKAALTRALLRVRGRNGGGGGW